MQDPEISFTSSALSTTPILPRRPLLNDAVVGDGLAEHSAEILGLEGMRFNESNKSNGVDDINTVAGLSLYSGGAFSKTRPTRLAVLARSSYLIQAT